MRFEWFISLRYLRAKRKQSFISIISVISVAGVMVGVMALIVVMAVMAGFTDGLRDKILGINSHVVVQQLGGEINDPKPISDYLKTIPGVTAVTPYLYTQAMITGGGEGAGAVLRGIDPESAAKVLNLDSILTSGDLASLNAPKDATGRNYPGIIIGKELSRQLQVTMGEKLRLLSAAGPLTPMGIIPQTTTCVVVGVFDTGMYEYDSSLAYVSMDTARRFLDLKDGSVHGLELKVDDIYQANAIAGKIEEKLGIRFIARDWMLMNKNLFSALQLEKTAMFIILALIVLVAAFNIVSTLIMVVMEKNKEIAILKSMGATGSNIMRIFIYEGLIIGLFGTTLGVGGGLGLCEILSRYQFIKLPSDVYPLSTLPVKILPLDVTLVAAAAVIITLLATIYPSWQASRVDPAEALRY